MATRHTHALIMRILGDGIDVRGAGGSGLALVEGMQALARIPPVVAALHDEVHFLVGILPHIAGEQLSGLAIEAHAPHVAKARGPDLGCGLGVVDERIVRGNGVGLAAFAAAHIDADDLAEQRSHVLAVAVRIVRRAAVSEAEIEHAVGAKQHRAAIVIGVRLLHLQEHLRALQHWHACGRGHVEAREFGAQRLVGRVVQEELMRVGELGIEHDRQQSELVARAVHLLADVHPHLGLGGIRLGEVQAHHATRLLQHVQMLVVAGRLHRLHRTPQRDVGKQSLHLQPRNVGLGRIRIGRSGRGGRLQAENGETNEEGVHDWMGVGWGSTIFACTARIDSASSGIERGADPSALLLMMTKDSPPAAVQAATSAAISARLLASGAASVSNGSKRSFAS